MFVTKLDNTQNTSDDFWDTWTLSTPFKEGLAQQTFYQSTFDLVTSLQLSPLFWFRSDTKTKIQIGNKIKTKFTNKY